MALKLLQEFSCWNDFFDAVETYSKEKSQPFVKASCKTCRQANKHVKEGQKPYPPEMEYVYYTYACTHGGSFKTSGQGKRQTKSTKQACSAQIYACLDRKDRKKIVVKQLNEEHTHEIGPDLFERYAKQRKLDATEKAKAEELVRLNVPPKDLRREMVRLTSKRIIMQDVHNIKKAIRHKDKQAASNGNDAQLLALETEKLRRKDPGLVSDFGVNGDGVLQYIFIQSSEMQSTFQKFPEHVLVDCTYCLNDRDMPLLSFLVVDGNSRSRLCGFALISNESSAMLYEIFSKFKEHNPSSVSIKTFMVDKDLNEVARLEEVFPNAFCELCIFHVKKAFKRKIDSLQAESNVKMEIRLMVEKLCNAKCAQQYDELKEELLIIHQPFSQYFLGNWDSIRERWVRYARAEHLNFGDSTNNRIESYHQKIKSVITSPAPLDICFRKVMFLYEFLLDETAHINFVNVTKKSFTKFPEIQRQITPHALTLAESEVQKANDFDVRSYESLFYVYDKSDMNNCHEVDGLSCTCHTSRSLLLPCRHIIAVRRDRGEEPLALSLFHQRWHISYNKCFAQPPVAAAGPSVSSFDWRTCAMEKKDRYGLAKPQVDRLLHLLVELGEHRLQYYLDLLREFEEKVSMCKRFRIVDTEADDDIIEAAESVGGDVEVEPELHDVIEAAEGVGGDVEVEPELHDVTEAAESGGVIIVTVAEVHAEGVAAVETGFAGVATVETDVATVETGVTTVETGVATVETCVATVETGVATVETGVATVETCVATVETGVATVETGVATVETGVATVETCRGDRNRTEGDEVSVGTNLWDIRPPLKLGKRGRPKGFGMSALGLPKKKRILKNKCNVCRKDDPLREISSGPTEWTGCSKCERWFHNVCIQLPDNGSFVCKFCIT